MLEVQLPEYYKPNLKVFFSKERNRWFMEYDLPSDKKLRTRKTLPSRYTSKDKRKVKKLAQDKEGDLNKGKLTQSEYDKVNASKGYKNYTFREALQEFHSLPDSNKTIQTIKGETGSINQAFKFFSKSFAKALEEEKTLNCYSKSSKGAIQNKYQFDHLKQIKEKHIFEYKQHLLSLVKERKEMEKQINLKKLSISSEEEKWELELQLKKTGISPSTARSYFRDLKTLFNRLEKNKKIFQNPCKEIETVSISKKDKSRSHSYTVEQVMAILNADYEHQEGFPLKEFFEALLEGFRFLSLFCLEWSDIIWERNVALIREKPTCPTPHGIGFKPKTGEDREIHLSDRVMKILKKLKKERDKRGELPVAYIQGDVSETPYSADFIWVCQDLRKLKSDNHGKWYRPNSIKTSWETLLKRAGLPYRGLDKKHFHDTRRFRNQYDKHVKNLDTEERSKRLGHSQKVNQEHYEAEFDNIIVSQAQELKVLKREIIFLREQLKSK